LWVSRREAFGTRLSRGGRLAVSDSCSCGAGDKSREEAQSTDGSYLDMRKIALATFSKHNFKASVSGALQ